MYRFPFAGRFAFHFLGCADLKTSRVGRSFVFSSCKKKKKSPGLLPLRHPASEPLHKMKTLYAYTLLKLTSHFLQAFSSFCVLSASSIRCCDKTLRTQSISKQQESGHKIHTIPRNERKKKERKYDARPQVRKNKLLNVVYICKASWNFCLHIMIKKVKPVLLGFRSVVYFEESVWGRTKNVRCRLLSPCTIG